MDLSTDTNITNLINLISAGPKDNIQKNNIKDRPKEPTPNISSLVNKSMLKILNSIFDKYNKNHSDNPRWLIIEKFNKIPMITTFQSSK